MMVSLDGFFEGPDHDLSWHNVDEEFNQLALKQLWEVDGLIFGRRTYEMMADYWPKVRPAPGILSSKDPGNSPSNMEIASRMNILVKHVFSRTLKKADWNNSHVINKDAGEELLRLKELPGRDLAIFGSSNLTVTFAEQGLVDEYRIMVNPVVLGKGTALLTGLGKKLDLKLASRQEFASGNVLLCYRPLSGRA